MIGMPWMVLWCVGKESLILVPLQFYNLIQERIAVRSWMHLPFAFAAMPRGLPSICIEAVLRSLLITMPGGG